MSRPARVLLVANFGDRVGGGEESFITLARGLDAERFAPSVVVPAEGDVGRELRRSGISVHVIPLPPVRPSTLISDMIALARLRALLTRLRIDVVHAHGSRGALYAGLAGRSLGIPLIWHVRITDRDRPLDGVLLALSTRVIAISEAVRRRFHGSSRAGKVAVVYNGVDIEWWTAGGCADAARDRPVVLVPARLMPEKGQETLLAAVPSVLSARPDARFVLLGSDADGERGRLERLVQQLGIGAAVEIRPWTDDPRSAFHEAAVVALPSHWEEPFGRVLIEAGCLGKPVVATRVGGIPEVVIDGATGLLVPPGDPVALARAINRLLADRSLREAMGRAARNRVLAHFSARRHVEGVQTVYDEVLAARDCIGASIVHGR